MNISSSDKGKSDAARIVACVNAFEGIDDPETWMRTNKEHVDGLLKGGAQNAKVALECGQELDKATTTIFNLRATVEQKSIAHIELQQEFRKLQIEYNALENSFERTTNILTDLKSSFWRRLCFLFSSK